jgi:tartrate-resistant acid phosphatase type 5
MKHNVKAGASRRALALCSLVAAVPSFGCSSPATDERGAPPVQLPEDVHASDAGWDAKGPPGDGDGDGDGDARVDAGEATPGDGDGDGDGDSEVRPDAGGTPGDGDLDGGDTPGDGDGDGDQPDAGGETPGDGDGDGDVPDPTAVRFVVLGDGGVGDAAQKKVAAAVAKVCAQKGCEFALYLGDNIYDSGVSGVNDAQFRTKFEEPYAALDFPFYVALGNHDYGSNGSNFLPEDAKSGTQVEYTAHSDKWTMPHYYYTFQKGPVAFFALDTNAIVLDRFRNAEEQETWLAEEMEKSDAPWKIVFGHHPYISNGEHGNAGAYAGGPFGIELLNGAPLRDLVDAQVCGKAQLFFAGHDHNREWLEPTCGTNFIVSGAAAKLRDMPGHDNPAYWGDGTKRGFLWVEIAGDTMKGVFYDDEGAVDYEDTVSR